MEKKEGFKQLNLRIKKRYHDQLKILSVRLNCSIREIIESWCKEKFKTYPRKKEATDEELRKTHNLADRESD